MVEHTDREMNTHETAYAESNPWFITVLSTQLAAGL